MQWTEALKSRFWSYDNTQDIAKGRKAPSGLIPLTGENNPSAKLCFDQVVEIRALAQTKATYPQIAIKYGVSVSLIGKIVRRQVWQKTQI